jgi:hypothetical protein
MRILGSASLLVMVLLNTSLPAQDGRKNEPEPLEAGGISSLPPVRTVPIPLQNGGFEDKEGGWSKDGSGSFTISEVDGAQGRQCLKYVSAPSKYVPSVGQTVSKITAGIYVLRFRVMTRGMDSPKESGGVRVQLQARTAAGRANATSSAYGGTHEWRDQEVSLLVSSDPPDGTLSISIHRYQRAARGEAFLDGFTLERVLQSPVEAYLLCPNYRGYLPANGPQKVRVWVRANDSGVPKVVVTSQATRKEVASSTLPPGQTEGILEWDASAWPEGGYSIQATLGESAYPAYVVRKISADRQKALPVWFDAHQVLHLNGKPTFPLGFYNTVQEFSKVGDGDIARLDKMAEAPVNFQINYTWWAAGMETRRRYLGEMDKRGMGYLDTVIPIHPGQKLPPAQFETARELLPEGEGRIDGDERCVKYLTRLAEEMRKLPGHTGWYVMDEREFDEIPKVFAQYQVLRKADPDHPTFGVSNRPGEFYLWRDTFDVFGLDPYPLTNMVLKNPLSMVGRWTRIGREATMGSRPVWTVIQFYQHFSKDRWATREELRAMSLMSVVEGARGLFFWSFGMRALSDVRNEKKRQEYWESAAAVLKEMKSLEPALLAPDTPEVVASVSDPSIRWRARTAEGRWTLFAYRPAEKFGEEKNLPPVTFRFKDGREVSLALAPDGADVVSVPVKP